MAKPASLVLRLALVTAAVILVTVALTSRGQRRDCEEAGAAVLRSLAREDPGPGIRRAQAVLLGDGCGDSRPVLASVSALNSTGRQAAGLPLARKAVRDEPENPAAWFVLAGALRTSDPAAARAAVSRARELNPLSVPAPKRR